MINVLNTTLANAEAGFLIRFSVPENLQPDTVYNIYFDTVVSLPINPPISVFFIPNNGSYTILGSSVGSPQVWVSIRSTHTAQTKTLIRLTIKNTNNTIVHTNYLLVVASPSETITFEGKILSTSSSSNFGPNNGRILEIVNASQSTAAVAVGDIINGPGIPDNIIVTIRSVISPSRIELLETPIEDNAVIDGNEHSGTFTILRQIGCVNPLDQEYFQLGSQYNVLDITNNWTFYVKNKIFAKLVIDDPIAQQDTIMLLPIKNASLISDQNTPPNIPALSVMKIGGRVSNNTVPVTDL
jgi:hypothetical protein